LFILSSRWTAFGHISRSGHCFRRTRRWFNGGDGAVLSVVRRKWYYVDGSGVSVNVDGVTVEIDGSNNLHVLVQTRWNCRRTAFGHISRSKYRIQAHSAQVLTGGDGAQLEVVIWCNRGSAVEGNQDGYNQSGQWFNRWYRADESEMALLRNFPLSQEMVLPLTVPALASCRWCYYRNRRFK
jgi:hypothetical protein